MGSGTRSTGGNWPNAFSRKLAFSLRMDYLMKCCSTPWLTTNEAASGDSTSKLAGPLCHPPVLGSHKTATALIGFSLVATVR